MASHGASGAGHNIAPQFDPVYWGVMISTTLVGITVVQGWNYMNHNNDGWLLRSLVAIVVFANFACTALDFQFLRHYLIIHFGDLRNLALQTGPFLAQYMLLLTLVFIAQLFFASRVYILAKKDFYTPAVIVTLGIVGYGFGVVAVVDIIKADYIYLNIVGTREYKLHSVAARLGNLGCDLVFTIALSWRLRQAKTTVRQTNTVLERLLTGFVGRGIVVTVCMLISSVLVLYDSTSIQWMIVDYCYSKIYVSTMLLMLNMRQSLRQHMSAAKQSGIVITNSTTTDIPLDSRGFFTEDLSVDKGQYTYGGSRV